MAKESDGEGKRDLNLQKIEKIRAARKIVPPGQQF